MDKPQSPQPSRSPQAAQSPQPPLTPKAAHPIGRIAPDPEGGSVRFTGNDRVEFNYVWPQEAADIPELGAWLRGNGDRLSKQTRDRATADQAAARKGGYPFNGYGYEEKWGVVADLPALLILQSEGYSFTGGAHGMPIVTTLFWDKARKKRLPTIALFDVPALSNAIRDRFCAALNAERSKRRGAPVDAKDPNQLSEFVRCVDIDKQIILPVSKGGKALDTVRIVIMPYEAGPYSEGIYQIDLPVDAAVLATVNRTYRGSFAS